MFCYKSQVNELHRFCVTCHGLLSVTTVRLHKNKTGFEFPKKCQGRGRRLSSILCVTET